MHQLWLHPNGYWYVLFGKGLKRRVSTRTKKRDKAEVFYAKFVANEIGRNDPPERIIDSHVRLPDATALRERNTVPMVAKFWGFSNSKVHALINSGTLGYMRIGSTILVTREQVLECEERCMVRARDSAEIRDDMERVGLRESPFQAGLTARRKFGPI